MKKFLSLVLALVMTMSLVTISAGAKDFTDADKVAYTEAVDVISAVKVVDGYADGSFNPTATLTRGAAAKIICNLILGPTTASALVADAAPYSDVPANSTFAGYIAFCAKEGIISGYADGTFKPGNTLTGYAFMKMLLGALGYDKSIEGYEGANWSINVAKRALSIGLDDGLAADFNGTKPVTREEACLYAFNTLKADLVEYDSTTNITIGGTAVVVGGSKAQKIDAVKNGAGYKGYNTFAANNDEYVQFCERYFSDLKLTNVTDDFERPANEWKVKTTKVGTYSKTPDLTYTKKVKSGTIYADLGLGAKVDAASVNVYTDGVTSGTSDIAKNGTYEYGKNGVKTEVYLNDAGATNTITICMTNTWIGQVTKVKDATKTADRAITVNAYGGSDAPTGFTSHNTKETEDFEIEDVVLYTYSRKAGSEGIKSLTIPETVTGTLTDRTAGDDFTLDGTTYEYSAKANSEADGITMKSEITAYLDTYGYSIFEELSKEADSHYAYVLGTGKQGNTSYSTDFYATLFLAADGTVVTVPTKKNYVDAAEGDYTNKVVSYTVDKDGKYTLNDKNATSNALNPIDIKRGEAAMTILGGTTYANSKTTFLVRTGSAGNYKYSVYTGIANVPSIKNLSNAQVAAYCKTLGMATVVYVDAVGATVTTSKDDVVYVLTSSQSNLKTNSDGTDYYVYDAIVNGEITKLSVAQTLVDASNTLAPTCSTSQGLAITGSYVKAGSTKTTSALVFSGMSLDNDNIVTSFVDATAKMYKATGTSRTSGGAVIFQSVPRTAAEDIKVFFMDEAGDLGATSISSIAKDSNDEVLFFFDDGEVSSALVLNKVNP